MKQQLPELEGELLALVHSWEAEQQREFLYNGRGIAKEILVRRAAEMQRAEEEKKNKTNRHVGCSCGTTCTPTKVTKLTIDYY